MPWMPGEALQADKAFARPELVHAATSGILGDAVDRGRREGARQDTVGRIDARPDDIDPSGPNALRWVSKAGDKDG